jgi:nitronate monooxygenase
VAAGGIGSGRAMAAALAAGAEAVRVGTRFIAAAEADYHPTYVDQVIAARGEDTVLTEAFSVMWPDAPHRVLRSCISAAEAFHGDVVGQMPMGDGTMPIPRFSSPAPTRETTGAVEAMALYAGQSASAVKERLPAATIMRDLADEAERLLRRWT